MDDFATFNEVYRTFFSDPYPARTTVQSDLKIPIEIDVIAVLPA
jgi:peptide/nickel transport system substrate-binding protein/2-iminobutanoate/2-iminopropanoate deaminase